MINSQNKHKKIKLFCLPYAGSSATVYNRWKPYLQEHIELCPLELSGRGNRYNEPLYDSYNDAVTDMYDLLCNNLDTENYAIFGHSLGCLLTYEIAYRLLEQKKIPPKHIFFSGAHPPYKARKNKNLHMLPDDQFMMEVFKYGGTPKEMLSHRKLLDIFVPILKADYKIFETYTQNAFREEKLTSDITSFNGMDDIHINKEDVPYWEDCTSRCYTEYFFEGGHFFINNDMEKILNIINHTLHNYVALNN